MANLVPNLRQKFFDNNGLVLAGGKIYTYAAGTTTPLATYTDATGATPNTNPVILNANGEADIWLSQSSYKITITDSADALIKTVDGVVLIDALSVSTAKIADGAVTTIKIADLGVTTAKLATTAVTTDKIANLSVTTAKINDAAVTTAKIADDAITAAKLNDDVYSTVFIERSKIINGDMDIWGRGFSHNPAVTGKYTADRWRYRNTAASTFSIGIASQVPTFAQAGYQFENSMKIQCTTTDAAVGAGDLVEIVQPIEGYFFRDLILKEFVFSFWVYSSKLGTYGAVFKNGITASFAPPTRSYVSEFTVNAINTWQKITIAVPAPSAGFAWNAEDATGLSAGIVLTAGTTYQTTKDIWQNGDYSGTSGLTNFADSTSNIMYITGVRLEAGSIPKQYESRHPAIEQLLCNRYLELVRGCYLSYNPNVAATAAIGGEVALKFLRSGGYTLVNSPFFTSTRCDTPTATLTTTGVLYSANFITGTAGPAQLDGFALVESELTF